MKLASRGLCNFMSAAAALFILLGIAGAAQNQVISLEGVGAVRIGMSLAAVEQALGARLDPLNDLVFSPSCWVTQRADRVDPGVQYTFKDQQLARVDIWQPRGASAPAASTADGIGIGSGESDVRQVYGGALTVTPDPYSDEISWLQVSDASRRRGMIFDVRGGKVAAIRTGLTAVVNEGEVCQ
jgi:hypothetical protein